ncbi:MAG TPA: phage holin family protein [Oscillospiraceae bacterium]|nr:phage holin family protein [Oscillospiraceae bacterium]
MKLLIKWIICAVTLFITAKLFPDGFIIEGGTLAYLGASVVLWLLNIFIRPLLQILSLPISLLTLGLFSLVVNAGVVAFADFILPTMSIGSFWICIFIALVITAGNTLFASNVKKT